MKKLFLVLTALMACTMVQAQDRHFESCPLTVVNEGWKTKTIDNVINGSLGIMLERFDQTWPTWMVGEVRDAMEKGLSKVVLDDETDLTVTVDSKNGYVSVGDAGTDGEYMSACYWNRSNGHKLLAVLLGKPTDPCIEVLCTYDYDPAKKCLTPEPAILKGYRWGDKEGYTQLFCHLPKVGKNVVVQEWGQEEPRQHTFTWDGMKLVFSKTEPLEYEDGLSDIVVNFKGQSPNVKDFVSAIISQDEMGEGWGSIKENWKLYRNGMKLMPGCEFIVDTQNGYLGFTETDDNERQVIECCYWNYTDKKQKLVAISNDIFENGVPVAGQFSGLTFYKYDSATRKMKLAYAQDLGLEFEAPPGTSIAAHALPRQGKTIVYTFHTPSGKIEKRMTWNGNKFVP